MSKYRVFENGKRCNDYNIKGWDTDTHKYKRAAEIYAYLWAFPVSIEVAEIEAPEMTLNTLTNYSQCEFPVMMEIREVSE